MQELVEIRRDDSEQVLSYRDYLQLDPNGSVNISSDRSKYSDLQIAIANHFLILEGMQHPEHQNTEGLSKREIYIQQEHRHLGGSSSDIATYNTEALRMIQSLLMFGCYNNRNRLVEAAKICYVAMKYHIHLLHPDLAKMEYTGNNDDEEGSEDTPSSLDEDVHDYKIGYSSLVQNEIAHRDEKNDWRYFIDKEKEAYDNYSDEDEDYLMTSTDRSTFLGKNGLTWGTPSDLMSTDRPSQYVDTVRESELRSVDASATGNSRRGQYITRLCIRHDNLQQAKVQREYIRQNQRYDEHFIHIVGISLRNSNIAQVDWNKLVAGVVP